jgi:hypothetical protein
VADRDSTAGRWPVVYYSPVRYRAITAAGGLFGLVLIAYGLQTAGPLTAAVGVATLLLAIAFGYASRTKLRGNAIALTREGDNLVGGELRRALPVDGATFELPTDYQGAWTIVLRTPERAVRLGAGGWRAADKGHVTRELAGEILGALGLEKLARSS